MGVENEETPAERERDRHFRMWKEQEAIAMHFNDLIARFRVQALGGTATIGAVAAAVFSKLGGDKATDAFTTDAEWTFVALIAFLFVAWAAIWRLDYGYYKPLLNGAVNSINKLETLFPEEWRMSTEIEKASKRHTGGHFLFYASIHVMLLLLLVGATSRTGPTHFGWGVILAGCAFSVATLLLARRDSRPAAKEKK